jgi:hypothetical protein
VVSYTQNKRFDSRFWYFPPPSYFPISGNSVYEKERCVRETQEAIVYGKEECVRETQEGIVYGKEECVRETQEGFPAPY